MVLGEQEGTTRCSNAGPGPSTYPHAPPLDQSARSTGSRDPPRPITAQYLLSRAPIGAGSGLRQLT